MTSRLLQGIRVGLFVPDRLMSECLETLLPAEGADVAFSHADPYAFLESASQHRPDVALADLRGFEAAMAVLREFHSRQPGLPLAVLSAHGHPSPEDCYREGAAAWIDTTGGTLKQLVETLKDASEGVRLFPMMPSETWFRLSPTPLPTVSDAGPMADMTRREREVLAHIGRGEDNVKVAALLGISERTVKCHVTSLYRKSGVENRSQLTLLARDLGIRPADRPSPLRDA